MTNEIVIEKNVPLPEKRTGRPSELAPVFRRMKPGDSVVLKGRQRMAFAQFMKRHDLAYATRLIATEGTENIYRCWRVDGRRKAA